MTQLKTVLHVHTDYSYDSNLSCAAVLAAARAQEVDCVAITDHDTIEGALRCRELAELTNGTARRVRLIVGEEISSRDGHILGLFLREHIPPKLTAAETVRRIRAQGGVALAPHPATLLCQGALSYAVIAALRDAFDGLEICNAQNPLVWEDRRAVRFARAHGLPAFVGADTHVRGHLDSCFQYLPEFDGPESFKVSLQRAQLYPGRHGLAYFAVVAVWHFWSLFSRYPLWGLGANFRRESRVGSGATPGCEDDGEAAGERLAAGR